MWCCFYSLTYINMNLSKKDELLRRAEQEFRGLDFPKHKRDLLKHVRATSGGDDMVDFIDTLSSRTYSSVEDVMRPLRSVETDA